MDETTITLRRACACAIPTVLEALAEYALRQTGPNRPRCAFLILLRVENDMVPVGIQVRRQGTLQSWGLYDKLPCPGDPLGNRELGVTTSLCLRCQAKAAATTEGGGRPPAPGAHGCSHTPCDGCDGDCCEELEIHFTYFPGFPLEPHEVRWFFFSWFGMHAEAQAALPKEYRNMAEVYLKHDAPPAAGAQLDQRLHLAHVEAAGDGVSNLPVGEARGAAGVTEAPAAPQPAQRRKPGAPQLHCNVWLFGKMSLLADPRQCSHLKPRWQELYLEEVGVEPEDWEKSFRAAARYCRILIARGHGELPA